VTNTFPARPNLDHLRSQAKRLLADVKAGDAAALRDVIAHLPAARGMTLAKARAAGFRLADVQSVIARKNGFHSWKTLSHHVEQLRALEGAWAFVALQTDGRDVPTGMISHSRLLIDGDRFRMESPEANYEGIFTIDASADPMTIDINFVEGPEAGNSSFGIFEQHGDQLTICLGMTGIKRPVAFSTRAGSGHALERLRRSSTARPASVSGGTAPSGKRAPAAIVDSKAFDVEMTPMMRSLEGDWLPVQLVMDGQDFPADWLAFGSRTATNGEMKVIFNGQVMAHAKVKLDEGTRPIAVDYLNMSGSSRGKISLGILEWKGNNPRFLIAAPGQQRPKDFAVKPAKGLTLSEWKRK
jgi:uncharacterized protein (TIGR03067 family)